MKIAFVLLTTTFSSLLLAASLPYSKPYQKVFCYTSVYGIESVAKTLSERIDLELARVQKEEPKAFVESISDPKAFEPKSICTTIRIAVQQ